MMLKVIRKFSCAHKLSKYEGKCANLHGHTYRAVFLIEGAPADNGMIADFSKIKDILDSNLPDHKYLNDLLENPTTENIASYLAEKMTKVIKENFNLKLKGLELWENDTSAVVIGDIKND